MAAFTRRRRYEESALRVAMSAVQKRNRMHEAAILKAIVRARRLHNSLIPISGLPNEILEKIFQLLFAQVPPDHESVWCIQACTHVCNAWRRVALGYPALWTTISLPLPSEKWVSAMYARSQSSPLSVTATVGEDDSEDDSTSDYVRYLVHKNLPRTKILNIDRLNNDAFNDIDTIDCPCPMLEQLVMKGPHLQFPNMIPAKYTPALRVLVVTMPAGFGWNAPCLTNLTSLDVTQYSQATRLQPIIRALRRMPSLERFSLAIIYGLERWRVEENSVELMRLSHLYLKAPANDVIRLLEKIRIPATASIHLILFIPWDETVDAKAVVASIRAFHDTHPNAEPITKLSFSSTAPWSKSLQCVGFSGVIMFAWHGTGRCYTPRIRLEFDDNHQDAAYRLTLSTFQAFASDALRELVMMDARWTEDDWRTALSSTPLLERIEAVGNACGTLCTALRSPELVPRLIVLKLRDDSFDNSKWLSSTDANDGAQILLLSDWLSQRAGAGHPLQRLDLRSSGIIPVEDLAQVRAVLPKMLIIEPCTDPGGPISFQWRSSFKHKGASDPLVGSECDTLLVCAHGPGHSDSSVVVVDELEVDDVDNVPHASEILETWTAPYDRSQHKKRRLVF
ncbi:hypothetical protein FA95DRAFT_782941 [Auriscalpium vulgare]|uniref:Uncharacterized protein n=1 Tax=Auriscalpium vulgare TaxID=40419 RepID=A0ACB8RAD7_9AGAM|nr:hypothetical protein FA95DRAFT_782941 [Auriscalpium vulgare]